MAITKLVADSLGASAVPNQSAFKNIIINGDMSIAQRATSATTLGHQSYGTVDRISQNLTASSFVCTGEQSTDAPEGFDYSFKVACTTADTSLAAGDRLFLYQRVEDRNLGYLKFGTSNAVSLTLSFHVKSNKTGTYQVNLWHNNASEFVSATYTINSADTWEKKTLTFIGDTSTSMANDSASALQVEMVLLGGTTYTSGSVSSTYTSTAANRAAGQTVNIADSTSNTWQITGMQLEVGTSASDFEFLPFDVNLRRCQRYFFKLLDRRWLYCIDPNNAYARHTIQFPVQMRAIPTSTISFSSNGTGSGVQFENKNDLTAFVNGRGASETDISSGSKFDAEL